MATITSIYDYNECLVDKDEHSEIFDCVCNVCFNEKKEEKKYELLIAFTKVKKEFRNEKLLMFFVLNFVFLDIEYNLVINDLI